MPKKPRKLDITCAQTDCGSGLHCFVPRKRKELMLPRGGCLECGATTVDWQKVHSRSIANIGYTFGVMRTEMVRKVFWEIELNEKVLNNAKRKGRLAIREQVYRNLKTSVGPAKPFRDGAQTSMPVAEDATSILPYARHGTGTCCRKCIKGWHGIDLDRPLSEAELQYLTELVCRYVEERIPDLTDEPRPIPLKQRSSQ